MGKISICHIEKRKTKREKKEALAPPVLAERGKGLKPLTTTEETTSSL